MNEKELIRDVKQEIDNADSWVCWFVKNSEASLRGNFSDQEAFELIKHLCKERPNIKKAFKSWVK